MSEGFPPLKKWFAILGIWLLVSCTARPETPSAVETVLPAPIDVLPAADVVSGWSKAEDSQTYDPETLFDFMNGAADLYFTYGFEELAVGRYENADGDILQVEVYRLATDADAYGLFTYNSYSEPVDIGVDGELESGYRLAFWQRRTFAQIVARNQVDDVALRAFGEAVASALPEGGERPALVKALPAEGMQSGSVRFFREKMTLDNLLWLGADDVLGLGADIEGVLARYQIDDQEFDLMLIAFPEASRAQAAQSGIHEAGVEDLIATNVVENTLGVVLGPADGNAARELLDKAMTALQ